MRSPTRAVALLLGSALPFVGCTKSQPPDGGRAMSAGGASSGAATIDAGAGRPARRRAVLDDVGGASSGPFRCRGIQVACAMLRDFPARAGLSWADGDDFHAGIRLLGSGLTRGSDERSLHLTGKVSGPGEGVAFWFEECTDLSTHGGVHFTLRGRVHGAPQRLDVVFQTNGNVPWQLTPTERKGACPPASIENALSECVPPTVTVELSSTRVEIPWARVSGGKPQAWTAEAGPKELNAVELRFPWGPDSKPYSVDVTLDDFGFMSGVTSECTVLP